MENNQYKILLVDDEPDVVEFIGYNLKKEGFAVFSANNGKSAISIALEVHPHLILLDVMMPKMDGIETCQEIRRSPVLANTIVAFLTARGEDYSQIAGFEAGADDYITKLVKPKVLVSRIKALLKRITRNEESNSSEILQFGAITIDTERYEVTLNEQKINLPRKEFELLQLLVSKPEKVFTRDEIYQRIWGNSVIVGDRTIDVHIRKLREKLGDDYIKTIKGVGYKFVE